MPPTGQSSRSELVLVDAHVHIYDCFELVTFFRSARRNFETHSGVRAFVGMLLLTESSGDHWFQKLAQLAARGGAIADERGPEWTVRSTAEAESLRVEDGTGAAFDLVAGRQLATEEDLEVLALGTVETIPDGLSLPTAVERVRASGSIPVIPWGFGKWWGARGSLLTGFLRTQSGGALFLGDNGGRPSFLPEPSQFELATARGMGILPGSDPLPVASESWRPGSCGFSAAVAIRHDTPWSSLKAALCSTDFEAEAYGARETPYRFLHNQILAQVWKRRRRPRDSA